MIHPDKFRNIKEIAVMNRPPKVRPKIYRWEVGFLMAKYSFKFKKSVVEAYLKGEGGYRYLSQKYGVESHKQVCRWLKIIRSLGTPG